MKYITSLILIAGLFTVDPSLKGQALKKDTFALTSVKNLTAFNVSIEPSQFKNINSLKVELLQGREGGDRATFARLNDIDFKDGIIEIKLVGKLGPNAPQWARGFVGIAFRINEDNSKFECIYLRPLNAVADDPIRRNRSVQYFSYPDYKFDRLRNESPGKYESYADIKPAEWIKIKIEVKGIQAKLFINDSAKPVLTVDDLKHGANQHGSIGLWVDNGTEAYFSDLKITNY